MSSYSSGIQYGYDEINVNSSDFVGIGSHFESNGIKSIKSREKRLQQKLQMNSIPRDPYDDLKVDHYSTAGINKTKIRRQIIQKPEDYFVMGRNDYNDKPHKLESFKSPLKTQTNKTIKSLTTKNSKIQKELEELERQNKMLTFFIFFLVIMVIAQYSKALNNHQPISVMILDPRTTLGPSTTPAVIVTASEPLPAPLL
jgi:hypothetical protein